MNPSESIFGDGTTFVRIAIVNTPAARHAKAEPESALETIKACQERMRRLGDCFDDPTLPCPYGD